MRFMLEGREFFEVHYPAASHRGIDPYPHQISRKPDSLAVIVFGMLPRIRVVKGGSLECVGLLSYDRGRHGLSSFVHRCS